MRRGTGLAALAALYVLVPLLQVRAFLDPSTSHLTALFMPPPAELANYILGVLCYHWMLANVIIAARIPLLQSWLPQDARIRYHILGTIGIAFTLLYHAAFKLISGKEVDLLSWTLLLVFVAMTSLALLWIPLPGFRRARTGVLRLVHRGAEASYELLKRLHNLLMLSLAGGMYLHLVLAQAYADLRPLSIAVYDGYFILALSLFIWSKLSPLLPKSFSIAGIETAGSIRVLRLVPGRAQTYEAGQFAFLRFEKPGLPREFHPFSFLSSPAEPELAFGVRALGDFTKAIDDLEIGDRLGLIGPFGDFKPRGGRGKRPLCLLSTGVGAVPFISIVKELHARRDPRRVRLYLSFERAEEIPELARLRAIEKEWPGFELRPMIGEKKKERYDEELLRRELGDPAAWDYMVCASPGAKASILELLGRLGVNRKAVRVEGFSFG